MKILLCITGSISAYKAPSIANGLRKTGHDVRIILTNSSLKFIGKAAFSSQGFKTYIDTDEDKENNVLHIDLITWADTILIAPLSAHTLSKIANGMADNLLTSVLRAFPYHSEKKLVFAPAMNTDMYNNPVTNEHFEVIKKWFKDKNNFLIIEPVEKELACGVVGKGALANSRDIVSAIND